MVTVLALLGVLGVLFAAAALSTREQGLLAEAPDGDPDVPLPDEPLTPEDVGRLRFSLAARGYRMSQVDAALERLAAELADRDRRIALLESAAEGHEPPAGVREATVDDLPVEPAHVPPPAGPPPLDAPGESRLGDAATASAAPAAAGPTTWSSPSLVPEFPVIDAPEPDGPPADPTPEGQDRSQ